MDIRIEKITLHNFKGVRDRAVEAAGSPASIEGRNGSGKSTVFDAFTWLLFGKDHRGQDWTNFDIKPIDPETGEPYHQLEHWVEAELSIDGTRRTLRREIRENWVKPRGQAEPVMQGHTQSFSIDGVPCSTKRDYDTAVAQWIGEDIFKMITNPLYLIDDQYTNWQARRKVLLSLAGNIDLTAVHERFADLLKEVNGVPMEQFRKKLAADKKACRKELDQAMANVRAWKDALPEKVDTKAVAAEKKRIGDEADARVDAIKAEFADIDAAVLDANEAVSKVRTKIAEKAIEIRQLQADQEALVKRQYEAAQRLYAEEMEADDKHRNKVSAALKVQRDAVRNRDDAKLDIAHLQAQVKEATEELGRLGKIYAKERDAAFSHPDRCPECGQLLPAEYLARERDAFEESRRDRLKGLKDSGAEVKRRIQDLRDRIAGRDADRMRYEAEYAAAVKESEQLDSMLSPSPEAPDYAKVRAAVEASDKYAGMAARIRTLEDECAAMQEKNPADTTELLAKRHELEAQIDRIREEAAEQLRPLLAKEGVAAERKRMEARIKDEDARSKGLADELARLERLEFSAAELVKAEIEAQTDAVNALFRVARWKMFDYTLDGGAVEMCEVMSPEMVPYRSMNDAMRIEAGMDVVRVISGRYDVTAPIFIDNAESVLRTDFGTEAQVIRLVVKDCDFTVITK